MPRPARSRARAPKIRIEVAPVFTGGLLFGRHNAFLRGRALAAVAIEAIILTLDGVVLGEIEYPPDPAPPEPTTGCVRGFAFTIARPIDAAPLAWSFAITVRTADGAARTIGFAASRDPAQGGGVLTDGPAWTEAVAAPAPPLLAYVDRAALDPGGNFAVTGWALGLAPILAVQVFLDADRVGAAVLGGMREDVAAFRPDYPNAVRSGYALTVPLGPEAAGAERIVVHIVAADGTGLRLGVPIERPARIDLPPRVETGAAPRAAPAVDPPAVDPPAVDPPAVDPRAAEAIAAERRRIHMFCDLAELRADGTLSITGWAVSAVGIAGVTVLLAVAGAADVTVLGPAETGQPRPDVADAFLTVPMARFAGFRFATQLDPLPAEGARILVQVENGLAETAFDEVVPTRVLPSPAEAVPAAGEAERFRLEIDRPSIVGGVMVEPVSTRLTVEGWAVSRAALVEVAVYLDGQRRGEAHYGLARQDVERAAPDWPNALRSGFAYHCPPRLLRNGEHRLEIVLRAADGTSRSRILRFTVQRGEAEQEQITIRKRVDHAEARALARVSDRLGAAASFRFLITGAAAALPAALEATLDSLLAQRGPSWRADLLAADATEARALRARLAGHPAAAQVAVLAATAVPWPPAPAGAEALCGVLAAGDTLDPAALAEVALGRALDPASDLLYADEARISPASGEREPFFKPDFSPTLLLATNYIGHPWFATPALLHGIGASTGGIASAGEYDLLLRATGQAHAVRHLPKLLCRRGPEVLDPPERERAALLAAATRLAQPAEVLAGRVPGAWRVRRAVAEDALVSIIIPTNGAGGHIETCLRTLRERTGYRNFEIICIENIPPDRAAMATMVAAGADRVLAAPAAFNWSRFNNLAAREARGAYLLFLNDDIEVEQEDWLAAMLEHAADPAVGVVGARLLYPDRTVQHAGMFLAGAGTGRHAFRFGAADDPGYFGLSLLEREASAVTGACMLMRRAHHAALGGFDEAHEVINNDLDFCLRTIERGLRVVYTPHACLIHHELASRGGLGEVFDTGAFERRWRGRFAAGDPFHNPNLSTEHDDLRPNDEPVRRLFGGGARIARAEIRRILVVKVDHIGDFVTALVPIRRLKAAFPAAAIHVLASPAAARLAALEPAIEEVIAFSFFHARSALGQREIEPAELVALRERLAPYRFDLAIDLRKHLDTRELLHCAGARWFAGFDHAGQFPWLDIALEWEGDRALYSKRQHITEDLLRLVGAVDLAAGAGASEPVRAPAATPLPPALGALFEHPVVCIHPGAGNAMKQWPAGHFAALATLLLEFHKVNILLIGGPDEVAIAQLLREEIAAPGRVGSVVGRLPLGELPGVLARCALFIGNDSGPKHIATALGVPTVAIHSGNIDPVEWGPVGTEAVAVARAMSCAPCYLNREEDCPRALACIHGIDPGSVYRLCRPVLAALVPAVTAPAPGRRPRAAAARVALRRR